MSNHQLSISFVHQSNPQSISICHFVYSWIIQSILIIVQPKQSGISDRDFAYSSIIQSILLIYQLIQSGIPISVFSIRQSINQNFLSINLTNRAYQSVIPSMHQLSSARGLPRSFTIEWKWNSVFFHHNKTLA